MDIRRVYRGAGGTIFFGEAGLRLGKIEEQKGLPDPNAKTAIISSYTYVFKNIWLTRARLCEAKFEEG